MVEHVGVTVTVPVEVVPGTATVVWEPAVSICEFMKENRHDSQTVWISLTFTVLGLTNAVQASLMTWQPKIAI